MILPVGQWRPIVLRPAAHAAGARDDTAEDLPHFRHRRLSMRHAISFAALSRLRGERLETPQYPHRAVARQPWTRSSARGARFSLDRFLRGRRPVLRTGLRGFTCRGEGRRGILPDREGHQSELARQGEPDGLRHQATGPPVGLEHRRILGPVCEALGQRLARLRRSGGGRRLRRRLVGRPRGKVRRHFDWRLLRRVHGLRGRVRRRLGYLAFDPHRLIIAYCAAAWPSGRRPCRAA